MRPHKLMVVDDSMVFRNRIARLAADPRLPRVQLVAMAENGEEAIAQARHHRPDLVTMDLTMPRMDGPACLEVLREQLPEARILVVSALSDRATALKALAKGAHGFLLKPFSDDQMVQSLQELMA
ncbi:MAG TPA: response regulator [Giesbergeria sp.]|jgi:two-component system chemotaxis response regulator CheY|uniref:response regulator transcription factor n=1 Tax=Comamonadaceae TaxID=80864 RepID=UPI00138A619C|nr:MULTISPECIES: response regulator [unclassified Acidovorax]MBL8364836.1 response regulator [Comamonas sp.]MCK6415001.1 response regulator [Giesbergeria sp.]MCL4772022.1 response regulator [Burkholderiaceae bacterium]MDQ1259618.1 two-component system, chemotaxis family, chemotaxis protein CheY [Pseudomonadota bacterium]NCU64676.1 response regulator [Acidovorax sp. 210-6]